jgi:RimJ/RimL family protein N-acetyltransferase
VLHGELVTLRAFRPDDLDALTAWANDLETELFGGGAPPKPIPRESVAEIWERRRGDSGSADFIIEADGTVIGECGVFGIQATDRTAEFGITIGDKDYWGRGYGGEATRLCVDYALRLRNLRKLCLTVLSNNPRAMRAYAKAGFVEEGRQVRQVWSAGDYVDLVHMAAFSPDA